MAKITMPCFSKKRHMKITKTLLLNKVGIHKPDVATLNKHESRKRFTKTEIAVLKVLEKVGLLTITASNHVLPTFGSEVGNLKIIFVKELPRSRDQIRTISTCFPKYVDNNSTFKGSILTYVFSTEKGILSISECITYGIGGKLIGFVTIS